MGYVKNRWIGWITAVAVVVLGTKPVGAFIGGMMVPSLFGIPSSSSSRESCWRIRPTLNMVSTPDVARKNTVPPPTVPLNPDKNSFAGMVEGALLQNFEASSIQRILDSWRWLDMGYEHYEFVGPQQNPPIPAVTSDTNCFQHAPSFVQGLTARTFWGNENNNNEGDDDNDELSSSSLPEWCRSLEQKYPQIKEEFQRVTSDMESLEKQGNNVWAGALTEEAGSYGTGWRTLVLLDRGMWEPTNVQLFPQTATAIRDCGVPATEVFFASMQPHSDIQPHTDFTNFVLTSHLALDIPENGKNKCRLSVGDDTRQWLNGKVMLFDTSILHDAINEADQTRYILMMRVWHPDLTEPERNALQFIYDALQIPELVSSDPGERFMAQQRLDLAKAFPTFQMKDDTPSLGERKQGKKSKKNIKKQRGGGGKGFGA